MDEPLGKTTDLELIHQVQQGETAAFDALMMRYNRAVYRLAYSMMRNHADANDISQETFIRAFRAIGRFDEQYRFYTWLHRICANLCFTMLKRTGRQKLVPLPGNEPGEEWRELPDPKASPSDLALARDLDRALTRLPADQRAVFVLRVKEELSYGEIAKMLGIPIGTVMSRLNRARLRLRELLKDYMPA